MILLLDNYDSFVHNIARYLRLGGKATRVIRSDAITVDQCWRMQPEAIVLSPGPHGPESAGCCVDVIRRLAGEIPMLGICLGHQAIAVAYGGTVSTTHPCHAIASTISHDSSSVFAAMPPKMKVGRYHSIRVDEANLPPALQVTAWTDEVAGLAEDRIVMGIADHARCVHGVQFHPESLLTEHGQALLDQFFVLVDRHHARRRSLSGSTRGNGRPVVWMSDLVDETVDETVRESVDLGNPVSPTPLSISARKSNRPMVSALKGFDS